jgi:type VI secretion system protein ImpL
MQSLQSGVIASYEADFVRLWEAMLADLDVRPPRSLAQAAQGFYILGSPASPMRDLLVSIARQVTLSAPPATMDETSEQGAGGPDGVLRVAALMPVDDPPPGWEVGARFQALRDLVGTGPGAPIDRVLKTLSRLQQQLARLAVLPPGAPAPPVGRDDPAVALRIAAGTQQLPVRRWLAAMATSGASLRSSGAKEQTISVYNSANGPGPACARTINNHFPFTPTATADASLEDFGRLFGRGGWLDGFFTTQLRPYVAISSHGWRPHAVDGVPAPVSQADLDQFQRVGAIRELFFAGGSVMPSVRFDITPLGMDQGADKVILDFDGTVVTYPDGAGKATPITWPGATKMLSLKLAWDTEPGIVELGPWALFRMFAHGTIQPATAGNRFSLTFSAGEHEARFEIHTASANTPFTSAALRDFRCPNVQ